MARIFPMMLGSPQARTYTVNAVWTAPAGVTSVSITGKGVDGTPANPGVTEWKMYSYEQYTYANTTDGTVTKGSKDIIAVDDSYQGAPVPSSYFGEFEYFPWGNRRAEYTFELRSQSTSTPAKTGASAVGFDKTFAGGVGVPAVPVTYDNHLVAPGNPYSLTIPAGASITIKWTE